MTERELLQRWQEYHLRLADHYGTLLAALERHTAQSPPDGEARLSGPAKGRPGNKARVPKGERTALPLRAKRLAAGISLTALSQRLGIAPSYVGQVESGAQRARPAVPEHWEAVLDQMIREQQGEPQEGND